MCRSLFYNYSYEEASTVKLPFGRPYNSKPIIANIIFAYCDVYLGEFVFAKE